MYIDLHIFRMSTSLYRSNGYYPAIPTVVLLAILTDETGQFEVRV